MCGHINKYRRPGERHRGRCKRLVRDASGHRYCEDHRDGGFESWTRWPRHVPPFEADGHRARTAAEIPSPRVEPTPERRDRTRPRRARGGDRGWKADGLPDRRVAIAVAEAQRIAAVAWRYQAEQRVIGAVGIDVHRRSKAVVGSGMCDALAALATDLEHGRRRAIRALEHMTASLLGVVTVPKLARMIARHFVLHVTAEPTAEVDAVIAALRAYGVLLCVIDGRGLQRCRCLRALAVSEIDETIRSEVREVVGHGLEQLGRESRPFV